MKKGTSILVILFVCLIFSPLNITAQIDDALKTKVDDLVHKHYINGIPYAQANSLGPDAVPYLLELLNNPDEKEFWVNIIVTLGHIESSTAREPLISFLENARGEVDVNTFKALLSVPFAIGCIASNGDPKALNYLIGKVYTPENNAVGWSFKESKINRHIAKASVSSLAVSGQSRAKAELLKLKDRIERKMASPEQELFIENIKDGLKTMNRIKNNDRSKIFNAQE